RTARAPAETDRPWPRCRRSGPYRSVLSPRATRRLGPSYRSPWRQVARQEAGCSSADGLAEPRSANPRRKSEGASLASLSIAEFLLELAQEGRGLAQASRAVFHNELVALKQGDQFRQLRVRIVVQIGNEVLQDIDSIMTI